MAVIMTIDRKHPKAHRWTWNPAGAADAQVD
jgi:hypothetical protein